MKNFIWIGAILLGLVLMGFSSYNGLVTAREATNVKWADVIAQYQRRADLIPNLVSTVQGVAKQEKDLFIGIADARARVGQMTLSKDALDDPQALQKFNEAQGQLGLLVSRLLSISEQYPQLKSNENFTALQSQLEGTENRIAVARKDFNETVQAYNLKVQRLPGAIFAKMFGFAQRPYFELQKEGQQMSPEVKF